MNKYIFINRVKKLTFLTNEERLMKNKTIYRFYSAALLLAAFLVFTAGELAAQNFEHDGASATYASPGGNGVIKFLSEDGGFTEANGATPLGNTNTTEIPGIVSWASTTNLVQSQVVQDRYYTNLIVEGAGNKTIGENGLGSAGLTGIFVEGDGYLTASPHCIYTDLDNDGTAGYGYFVRPATGTRTYAGIFNYSGYTDQYIYEEYNTSGGSDSYNRLDLANSTKYGAAGITVDDDLVVQTGATLQVQDDFIIANAAVTNSSDIAGTVNVEAGGTLNLKTATGILDVNGTLNLANDATSVVDLDANTTMNVIGDFVNSNAARDNMAFDVTSLVHYQGDRTNAVSTNEDYPYGFLEFSGGTANYEATNNGGTENSLYVAGEFSLADASLDMAGGTGGSLWMTGEAANYTTTAPNDVEVIGSMRRGDFGTQVFALGAGPYTYNNEGTTLSFVGGVTPDLPTGYVELVVSPSTDPTYNGTNPALATTIQRSVIFDSENDDGSLTGFTIGYRSDLGNDETRGMTAAQLTRLLPYEGQAGNDGDFIYDIAGSNSNNQANNVFGATGTFEILANASFPGTFQQIASGSDLFAAYTGVFTVNDGRWSDPLTWVNGWVPIATDDAEVRHVVFTGYDGTGPFSQMAGYDHDTDESDPTNPGFGGLPTPITDLTGNAWLIANSVTIAEDGGTGYGDNIALIIGGTDPTMATENMLVYGQSSGTGTPGIFVENTDSHGAWPDWGGSYAGLNGLYVLSCTDEAWVPSIRGWDLVNSGGITNDGLIEVGD